MSESAKVCVAVVRNDGPEPGWAATICGQLWYFRDMDYGGRDGSFTVAKRIIEGQGAVCAPVEATPEIPDGGGL